MIKTIRFSDSETMDDFIYENKIRKDDIIQIMTSGEDYYPSFFLVYETHADKPEPKKEPPTPPSELVKKLGIDLNNPL